MLVKKGNINIVPVISLSDGGGDKRDDDESWRVRGWSLTKA